MPHTSRRGSKVNFKYQHVTDQNGWTHVFRGSKSSAIPISDTKLVATKIPKGLTMALVMQNHQAYVQSWNDSTCCKDLERIIEQQILPVEHVRIEKCVCLGLGSFTSGTSTRRESSWFQLVALQSMLRMFNEKHVITNVFFQDPQFNAMDEQFLQYLGYSVVQSPGAYNTVDSMTLLYIPHGELEVTARALNGTIPALFVGNDIAVWTDSNLVAGEKQQLFRGLQARSIAVNMPKFEPSWVHNDTVILWSAKDLKLEDTAEPLPF